MTPATPERWAVVGGGMLGLTLALRLADEARNVTVLEAEPELGGLAAAWTIETREGSVTWDRHYHVTLRSDDALRSLLAELGLEAGMSWVETGTGYYAGGRLSPVSSVRDYLALPALSPWAKGRLGVTILWGARVRDWQRLEDESVEAWLTRWSGAATFRRFWLPLLRAKLGESWRETSAAFVWATIRRLTAARRAGLDREELGYVPGGYARVLERFATVLGERGVALRAAAPVERIDAVRGGGLAVTVRGCAPEPFDQVVVTTDTTTAERICRGLDDEQRSRLRSIRYQGLVCVSVVLRHSLSPYYLTYLLDDVPFTAVVEMTALVDPRELGEHALVYLPKYVASDDPLFEAPDAQIEAEFLEALRVVHPQLADDDVLACRVSRARRVFPVPTLGYSRRVPGRQTAVPGLHLVSSAQIVNGTLNVNETVQLAEAAARALVPDRVPAPTRASP